LVATLAPIRQKVKQFFIGAYPRQRSFMNMKLTRCEGMKQKKLTAKNVILHVALQAGGTENVGVSRRV
jgi:hypothetical protein